MPSWYGSPAVVQVRSFTSSGTPRNGPSAGSAASAFSKSGWMTAFRSGLSSSIRRIAASVSSRGEASPEAMSAAWAVASMAADPTSVE